MTTDVRRVGRPVWHRSLPALIGLGVLFYSTYGLANWLASLRSHVPSIVYDWERAIPFLAWTIIPYWTTNLFYAASLFLCRSRHELALQGKRLMFVQLVAVACFIAVPLRFSWPKPQTSGLSGQLFDQLASFDMPFNQAPSLHVALTVVLASFYLPRLPSPLKPVFVAWSALVVISTLTTYQHHFVDLPTGALLGCLVVWALPFERRSPLAGWRLTGQPDRRRLGWRYAGGAALSALLALPGGTWLWFLWPALALALVALAYLFFGPAAFGKSEGGRIGFATQALLAPYLLGAWINSRLWTRRDPHPVEVAPGLWLGRFPSRAQAQGFARLVDLTAEFHRPRWADGMNWRTFPCLDLVAPEPAVLRRAADAIAIAEPDRPVLVCCALGYGRSVATLAAWLVINGHAEGSRAAIDHLRWLRPKLAVTPAQLASIGSAVDER